MRCPYCGINRKKFISSRTQHPSQVVFLYECACCYKRFEDFYIYEPIEKKERLIPELSEWNAVEELLIEENLKQVSVG